MTNTNKRYLFTSESVSEGHPDKVCDRISDAVLDAALEQDPSSRVACETLVSTGLVVIAGEITTAANIDYQEVARAAIRDIGYTDPALRFDADGCAVMAAMDRQSADIAMGVDQASGETGAGDQGMMFGYAAAETDSLMPAPIHYAHALVAEMARARKANEVNFLRPDSKSQVTFTYEGIEPVAVETVVISTQHSEEVTQEDLRTYLIDDVIKKIIPADLLSDETRFLTNPTGRFVIGGPHGDAGVTGRKIIVDTYGGAAPHGGGAFSGKDPTKVDRSAHYMGRYLAKNVVAAGLAKRCTIQLAYAIGVAQPVSVLVELVGDVQASDTEVGAWLSNNLDLSPAGIIKRLDLLKPQYQKTVAYGHFGREGFGWENTDLVDELKSAFGG